MLMIIIMDNNTNFLVLPRQYKMKSGIKEFKLSVLGSLKVDLGI